MTGLGVVLPSVVAIVLLVAASAFFSSSESAIFSLPEEWTPATSADGSSDSRALGSLREDPHRLLVTILVGNNLVNIAVTSIVTLVVIFDAGTQWLTRLVGGDPHVEDQYLGDPE